MPFRIVDLLIHAHADRRIGVRGGRGDQDFFGAALGDMHFSFFSCRKMPGGLENDFGPKEAPWKVGRIALLENHNLLAVDDKILVVMPDFPFEAPVDRVPLQQVSECFGVGKVVDRHDVRNLLGRHRAENIPANSAEAINANFCHIIGWEC